jgi:hypothetical protein
MFVVIIAAVIVVLLLPLATLVEVDVVTFDPTAIIDDDIEDDAVRRRSQIIPSVMIPILLRKRPKKGRPVVRGIIFRFCGQKMTSKMTNFSQS